MSYSIEHIVKLILHAFLVDIVPFVISLSLGLLILLLLVRRRIVLPINAISDSMKRYAQDSSTRPEPLNIPKELPHNTAAHLAVPFPPVISCRFFDLPPGLASPFLLKTLHRSVFRALEPSKPSKSARAPDEKITRLLTTLIARYFPKGDEIGDIAAAYEKMTEDISGYVGNIEALTQEKVEVNVQLDVARRIQYGLVPKKMALTGRGYQVCAMTEPAKAVGDDFYDCFQRDEHNVYIVMGDVSGKGVTAAIFMAMIRTVIRQKLMAGLGPAEALNQTNDEICAENPENLFVTAFAAVLDPLTGVLRYANAGHNYPVLLKAVPEYLHPDEGIALGMFEIANLVEGTLSLSVGEGLLLYTDGVTEALGPNNTFFGEDRLLGAVMRALGREDPAEEILREVSRAVFAFCDGKEPSDDMAVLALFREKA